LVNLSAMNYDIRPIHQYDEFKACERLQAEVLGFVDLEVAPYQLLHSFATSGGAVVGAFDAGELIGFVMGYTGLLDDGTPYHRSQRMAVQARYRGQGVGEALKRAQAGVAQRYGLRLMCWTYDPLRSLNAHLNIHKLGATSRRYIQNAYAATSAPRDAGVAIDRLWVEWVLGDDGRPTTDDGPDEGRGLSSIVHRPSVVLRDEGGLPGAPDLAAEAPVLAIQIPQDVDAVRASGVEQVVAWREATRAVFAHYFARGYRVVDFQRGQGYLLARRLYRAHLQSVGEAT
jgi:chorismate synthase